MGVGGTLTSVRVAASLLVGLETAGSVFVGRLYEENKKSEISACHFPREIVLHFFRKNVKHSSPPLLLRPPNSRPLLYRHRRFLHIVASSSNAVQLIVVNNCKDSIWPGILATEGHPTPANGGFLLHSGQQRLLEVPERWSGRIWARQGCCFDPDTGKGVCQTGDCDGRMQCKGIGGAPPATLVEMTFGTSDSPLHYYDVSLVDGFNLPVSMVPLGGGDGGCGVAACETDLNVCCPLSLVVKGAGKVVGCKSACLATGSARYCCTGEFARPENCRRTVFDRVFKAICPRAYSYAFDERTGLKTCSAPRYVISFCPPN